MDPKIAEALTQGRTIDITTIGRRSGEPRRIEIWFHNLDRGVIITGLPGRRGWYSNLLAHPEFTFHLKEGVEADLPARATPVTDEATRRQILDVLLPRLGREDQYESWLKDSPIVDVEFLET